VTEVHHGPRVYRGPGGRGQGQGQGDALGWDREVAVWMYLGIGDLDVPWPLGVYRGPGGQGEGEGQGQGSVLGLGPRSC